MVAVVVVVVVVERVVAVTVVVAVLAVGNAACPMLLKQSTHPTQCCLST